MQADAYVNVAKKVCDDLKPGLILLPATATGKDLSPRLAARLGGPRERTVIKLELRWRSGRNQAGSSPARPFRPSG